jgi:predicted nucleic acid-binding protein
MPDRPSTLVTNTTPLIALTAAMGDLDVLRFLYQRVARLCGLTVTGTVGLLLKAQQLGYQLSMPTAIARMQEHGIWLSSAVVQFALAQRH